MFGQGMIRQGQKSGPKFQLKWVWHLLVGMTLKGWVWQLYGVVSGLACNDMFLMCVLKMGEMGEDGGDRTGGRKGGGRRVHFEQNPGAPHILSNCCARSPASNDLNWTDLQLDACTIIMHTYQ